MQTGQTEASITPPDLEVREHLPYYRWMRREAIPTHFAVAGISDITAVPRKPWARTGKGLGAFLELNGTHQSELGMFVCEIPGGESLDVQHHLYEQFTLILQGRGATEIWQKDGPKRTFEWARGSLFAPPKNTYYRMFNLSNEPVLYFGVTTAPRLFNGLFGGWRGDIGGEDTKLRLFEFVFQCDHGFTELYDGGADHFQPAQDRVTTGRHNASL